MSESFIHQIARHSGLSPADAEDLLGVFVSHLEDELQRSGAAVIPGVGTFSRDNGSTEFEPDPALAFAVNFRNAGLDLIPAAVHGLPVQEEEEPEGDDQIELEPAQVSALDPRWVDIEEELTDQEQEDVTDDRHESYAEPDEHESAVETEDPAEISGASTLPIPESEPDSPEEIRPHEEAARKERLSPDADDEDVEASVEELSAGPEMASVEEEGPVEPLVTEAPPPLSASATEPAMANDSTTPSDRPPEEPSRPKSATPWLLVAVAVLFLAIVGLMVLFMTGDRDPRPGDEAIVEAPQPIIDEDEVDDPAADEVDDPPGTDPEPEPPAPFDPLRGDEIDRSQSRYTLVVASLPSDGAAEVVMNQWRNRGFRTAVFSETIDGVTRHRVGVGQFETIDEADAVRARNDLEFPLPEGTWVYRYPASPSN